MIDLQKMAKEHEKLFPKASMESQVWKLEEEIDEVYKATTYAEKEKEVADVIIVCGGLYRWCPNLAEVVKRCYEGAVGSNDLENEVNRKWQVNLGRKWEWNGKTYKHVGKDGNE